MKFLHLAIGFKGETVTSQRIQEALGKGPGWARYAPNCWILYTDESPEVITARVRAVVSTSDSIFVCEINSHNAYGYLQDEIWKWFRERQVQ